jgi:hypothetical protein
MKRDEQVNEQLRSDGWTVLRYWESTVLEDPNGVARAIAEHVRSRPVPEFRSIPVSRLERRRAGSVRAVGRRQQGQELDVRLQFSPVSSDEDALQ